MGTLKTRLHGPDELLTLPAFGYATRAKRGMELVNLKALGIMPVIGGGARGYNTEGDVITQTADGRDLNQIWAEFQQTIAVRNEQRNTLVRLLTYPVTQLIEDVVQVVGDDFEEASEFGEPKGLRTLASYFSMAYDFRWYDLAARYTWKYLAEATTEQVGSIHNAALEADNRLVFQKVMKTLFNPTNSAATIKGQNYTVYKFYNADGTVPPDFEGNTFNSSHTHYLTTGHATQVDPTDIERMISALNEHGYSSDRGARVILLANRSETATLRTFRFGATTNGGVAAYDFIPSVGQPGLLLGPTPGVTPLNVTQAPSEFQGLKIIGSYGDVWIAENSYVPAGYMAMFATGGVDNLTNPIGFREHVNPSLRGLRLVKGPSADYPLTDSFYNRGFGTGIRQRGAGALMQVTASGTYTAPAIYA